MKKTVAALIILSLSSAVIIPDTESKKNEVSQSMQENLGDKSVQNLSEIHIEELEKIIHRKLNFNERISFLIDKKGTTQKVLSKSEPKKGMSGLTIAGFTSAVVGLFFLPALFSTAGLVLSAISLYQAKKNNQEGRGLAFAGLIAGIVGVTILLLSLIAII